MRPLWAQVQHTHDLCACVPCAGAQHPADQRHLLRTLLPDVRLPQQRRHRLQSACMVHTFKCTCFASAWWKGNAACIATWTLARSSTAPARKHGLRDMRGLHHLGEAPRLHAGRLAIPIPFSAPHRHARRQAYGGRSQSTAAMRARSNHGLTIIALSIQSIETAPRSRPRLFRSARS